MPILNKIDCYTSCQLMRYNKITINIIKPCLMVCQPRGGCSGRPPPGLYHSRSPVLPAIGRATAGGVAPGWGTDCGLPSRWRFTVRFWLSGRSVGWLVIGITGLGGERGGAAAGNHLCGVVEK